MTKTEALEGKIAILIRMVWDDGYASRHNSVLEFGDGKTPWERNEEYTTQILHACKDAGLVFKNHLEFPGRSGYAIKEIEL